LTRRKNAAVTTAIPDELTTIELLVLWEAGGDNTLGNAYGAVQLYTVFEREEELLDATQGALLRLLDLGLARFVEASDEVGYTAKRHELSSMTREQLVVALERDRNPAEGRRDTQIWYDPTPEGQAVLAAVPADRIPQVSGVVRRPWLKRGR
jgi:hypothetical protein